MLLYYLRLLENTPMTFWFLMDFFFLNLRVKKEGELPWAFHCPPPRVPTAAGPGQALV